MTPLKSATKLVNSTKGMQLVAQRFQFGMHVSQASSRHPASMYLQDGANELNELYGQDLRAIAPVLGMQQ